MMKLYLMALLGLLSLALAKQPLKSVIITFPKGTPSTVISDAKDSLVASGSVITHEYHLINGFAAEVPVDALQTFSTQTAEYKPEIEEDKVVSANGDGILRISAMAGPGHYTASTGRRPVVFN